MNLDIPTKDRCPNCKGKGEFHSGVCTIAWHPQGKTHPCTACEGTGLNEDARAALRKEERALARRIANEKKEKVTK